MREAMARAEVGDDVWEEDPTVKRLEAIAAERLGKAAGLFVASGTMGNLVSVVSHTRAGQEVVLDLDSHIFNYEVAGAAVIGSVQMRPVKTARGFLTPEQVREALRPAHLHVAAAGLVALERMVDRLAEDHATARRLAEGIAKLPGLTVNPATVQTNIVIFGVERPGGPGGSQAATGELVAQCAARKVKIHAIGPTSIRCVTHKIGRAHV